eukprot:5402874-Ditylum_brightwellii.AAC.1
MMDSTKVMETETDPAADPNPDVQVTGIVWSNILGGCTDKVLQKTLENITQYYLDCMEAETHSYPKQHMQKQLFLLHLCWLQGRTCTDTFFSSVKSVCSFTCVQLFIVLSVDYLWVKLLRRESQVPGSYQDFCREAGAPNELLTNNSRVQAGSKFTKIDWKNITPHLFSTPHGQNQNNSERKIQDCYAVKFAIDCLNHIAKKGLEWKTPTSVLSGNTADISVFRFHFWQPNESLDSKPKFPDCKWQKKRFVGIAWDHSNPFTYLIWTEPDEGGWKKGR